MTLNANVTESVTFHRTIYHDIRIWRDEPVEIEPNTAWQELHLAVREAADRNICANEIAQKILAIDRVSAVEVKDSTTKNAIAVYKNWP